MGALHPAASADEMEALPIRRQAMSREQKTAFDKQRLACLSQLVKYFSDSELSGLKRAGSIELLAQRARACGAQQKDVDALIGKCEAWLTHSQAAIAGIRDEAPFFIDANGEPTQTVMIAYLRSTRCSGTQVLPIRLSEGIAQANRKAEERFKDTIRNALGLSQGAGIGEVRRASHTNRHYFNSATCFAGLASDSGVNLTDLSREALDALRTRFAATPLSDGSRMKNRALSKRKFEFKPFTDFLAAEYEARRCVAAGESSAVVLPGSNPA